MVSLTRARLFLAIEEAGQQSQHSHHKKLSLTVAVLVVAAAIAAG